MTAPDFMPVLSAGGHERPEQGACVMEYVSMIAGEPFTDLPECTDQDFAFIAQTINDRATDDERHLLIPLIPRLLGARFGNPSERTGLLGWAATNLTPACSLVPAVAISEYVLYAGDCGIRDRLARFHLLLDEFDRITGHKPTGIAPAEMAAAVALVKQ